MMIGLVISSIAFCAGLLMVWRQGPRPRVSTGIALLIGGTAAAMFLHPARIELRRERDEVQRFCRVQASNLTEWTRSRAQIQPRLDTEWKRDIDNLMFTLREVGPLCLDDYERCGLLSMKLRSMPIGTALTEMERDLATIARALASHSSCP